MEQNTEQNVEKNAVQKPAGNLSFLGPLIIGASIVASCVVLVTGITRFKWESGHSISATGSASMNFDSDLIVWKGYFTAEAITSKAAYDKIKKEASIVEKYLIDNGVAKEDILFSSVDITEQYDNTYDDYGNLISSTLRGYELEQNVKVSSSKIDEVELISHDISSLLDSGVEFNSDSPEYYCTTLDDVKLDLIEKATENAKARIDIMAEKTGASTGRLLNSNLGVFQITAANTGTSDYTYDGYYDTSSREKTATITVRLEYSVK